MLPIQCCCLFQPVRVDLSSHVKNNLLSFHIFPLVKCASFLLFAVSENIDQSRMSAAHCFVSDERLGVNQDIVLGHSLYYSEDSYIPPSL